MNTEMMALYKVEGFNPYGSCLPMLPQIPLFIAYYHVLQAAVELRQAHWFWLPDLSAPDPTYIPVSYTHLPWASTSSFIPGPLC